MEQRTLAHHTTYHDDDDGRCVLMGDRVDAVPQQEEEGCSDSTPREMRQKVIHPTSSSALSTLPYGSSNNIMLLPPSSSASYLNTTTKTNVNTPSLASSSSSSASYLNTTTKTNVNTPTLASSSSAYLNTTTKTNVNTPSLASSSSASYLNTTTKTNVNTPTLASSSSASNQGLLSSNMSSTLTPSVVDVDDESSTIDVEEVVGVIITGVTGVFGRALLVEFFKAILDISQHNNNKKKEEGKREAGNHSTPPRCCCYHFCLIGRDEERLEEVWSSSSGVLDMYNSMSMINIKHTSFTIDFMKSSSDDIRNFWYKTVFPTLSCPNGGNKSNITTIYAFMNA
ncbi:hypothetical protein FOZ63_008780, partial [Perkinsus olseni]